MSLSLQSFWDELSTQLVTTSGWEVAAVILALLYLLLAVRQIIWCWYAAFASTAIYLLIFYRVQLPSESLLQFFYMVMAVYGWWQWRYGGSDGGQLRISVWSRRQHVLATIIIVSGTVLLGWFFDTYSQAVLPYEDAFTTSGAVVATYMTAKKILDNWYYWFVIDSISIHLYVNRSLYLTAVLFLVYLFLIVAGFIKWHHDYRNQVRQS